DSTSDNERHTGRPAISPPLRLTRWISPLNPPASRLRVTAAPTEPGRSLAPMATTDFGAINLSRLRVDMVTDHHGLWRHSHDSEPGAKQAQHDDAAVAAANGADAAAVHCRRTGGGGDAGRAGRLDHPSPVRGCRAKRRLHRDRRDPGAH